MARWWNAAAGELSRAVALSKPRASSSSSATISYHTIQAIPRDYTGSKIAARDRAQGRIPAVIFAQQFQELDPNESTISGDGSRISTTVSRKHLITTERKQIHSILKSVGPLFFCSTTFQLQIRAGAGSSHLLESGTVLPIKVHKDAETGKILNLVFAWANSGSELKVDVPIVFKGEDRCPGILKGNSLSVKWGKAVYIMSLYNPRSGRSLVHWSLKKKIRDLGLFGSVAS
ncbi:50S ribosomal protein L25 isoform X2 [Macadamia integrifolia]|uniref:50S ribosomal protein L25 isoform X2 n=1 Tax=Macadamia integrifolia TaxID=60698 RepID=UPI001C4E3177|nr:50S ribosomal protein L25 isoform X2 [Macadamia integrifolia]